MNFASTRFRLALGALAAAVLALAAAPEMTHAWDATQAAARSATPVSDRGPRLDFLGEWGTRGDGPANLNMAVAITADARGRVYIADAGSGFLHKFTADGHPLLAFDDPRVSNPVAVAVDSDGDIFAADGRTGRVMVFDPTGDPNHEQHAAGLGRFRSPSSLAVDADDNLYVADAGLGAVAEYDWRGRLVRIVARAKAGNPRVRTPVALAAAPDGSMFVADGSNALISRFSARGEFLGALGKIGGPLVTRNPVSLVTSDRYLFCFDAAPPRLLVWTLNGQPYFQADLSARIALSSGSGDTRASLAYVPPDALFLLDPSSGKVLRFRWSP
ncbi:MAG TPA: NHL repeat-containing protein [Candidatus Acidoferrales bacterium]|nr:NHL repeat-containing protein [Candidatus Acidoferrales bacterium]